MSFKNNFLLDYEDIDFEPVNSFDIKKTLNPKVWNGYRIKENISKALYSIAKDYIDNLELEIDIDDIILTGSMSNFNYSKYSDYDLHIVVDFSEINSDVNLVKKFFDANRKNWNDTHDIMLREYEVEIYVQDINEPHIASGVFSILNNKWVKIPTRKNFVIDTILIKQKAQDIMTKVDELEVYPIREEVLKLLEKISKMRKTALEEHGEFAIGNLIFKTLRRNGYIGKLITLRSKTYDKSFESLVEKILLEAKQVEGEGIKVIVK